MLSKGTKKMAVSYASSTVAGGREVQSVTFPCISGAELFILGIKIV